MNTLSKDEFVKQAQEAFKNFFFTEPLFIGLAPGRINIIGEHVDYLHGLSIPTAIDRWAGVTCSLRTDKKVVIKAQHFSNSWSFEIGELQNWLISSVYPVQLESWSKYVLGAFVLFFKNYSVEAYFKNGLNIYVTGNVPLGKGLSSSAALEVALLNALRHVFKVPLDDDELIRTAQQIEHQFLATPCGLMDQYASQFSRKNELLVIDFLHNTHMYIPALQQNNGLVFVCLDSMASRELAHSEYGKRVEECARGMQIIKQNNPQIINYRDILPNDIAKLEKIDSLAAKRIRYMFEENERTKKVCASLRANDWNTLGRLLNETHAGLRDLYQVSSTSLDFLQEQAAVHPACLGARMMGGGFGGCTLNLVKVAEVDKFCADILAAFAQKTNMETEAYIFNLDEGAKIYTLKDSAL